MAVALELDSNLPQVEQQFAALLDALPQTLTTGLEEAAGTAGSIILPVLASHTPVRSGKLRDSGYLETQLEADSATLSVGQDAANERSGYHYAPARAFGHVIANQYGRYGEWTPPESPVYPQAALDEAMTPLLDALAGTGYEIASSMVGPIRG